jgi:hypothetical protein
MSYSRKQRDLLRSGFSGARCATVFQAARIIRTIVDSEQAVVRFLSQRDKAEQ